MVVTAAEWGRGRRNGKLSNLHLSARGEQEGQFVVEGKTFKGMTDETLEWQTRELLARQVGRRHVVFARPELVAEVAFDGILESPQYPGRMDSASRAFAVIGTTSPRKKRTPPRQCVPCLVASGPEVGLVGTRLAADLVLRMAAESDERAGRRHVARGTFLTRDERAEREVVMLMKPPPRCFPV